MKKIIALTLSSLLCISAVGCSSKKNNNDIVATVNGNNITMVDPGSNQTDLWSAYEFGKTSQFNYFKTN